MKTRLLSAAVMSDKAVACCGSRALRRRDGLAAAAPLPSGWGCRAKLTRFGENVPPDEGCRARSVAIRGLLPPQLGVPAADVRTEPQPPGGLRCSSLASCSAILLIGMLVSAPDNMKLGRKVREECRGVARLEKAHR